MILAGRARLLFAEALVIASALAVPDPRERPLEKAAGGRSGICVLRRALGFLSPLLHCGNSSPTR
jgi:hypothetical protein